MSDGDIIGAVAPKREAERKWSKGPWQWGYSFEADLSRWALRASGNPLAISGRTHRAIANRNLIASAPDLYEAAEECLSAELERRKKLKPGAPATTYCQRRIDKISAALRKARGEPP